MQLLYNTGAIQSQPGGRSVYLQCTCRCSKPASSLLRQQLIIISLIILKKAW